jgi:hypothetical protein
VELPPAVAADHHQPFDPALTEPAQGELLLLFFLELGVAGAAEHRAALQQDAADAARVEAQELTGGEAGEAALNAEDLHSHGDPDPRHCAKSGVHARGVPATGQHRDLLHRRPSLLQRVRIGPL